ncbi:MAG TPA: poly(R)-hydroxyalkanoic acid synthase subunit PhaE [Casimicrobiaceae bacterium]|nr:poly(R)-hydroxyalkanoic acid synthase subunit PhaE [Casimicrobiaceae bacterium]
MATPYNWFEESSKLVKAWAEQQQNFLQAMTGARPPGLAAPGAMPSPFAGMQSGLQQAQDLWRGAMEKWMQLAPQGIPKAGNVDDLLKALFDPAQWAQAGLGPLDRAIEHLVEGPSYATLWTLDRKLLRVQKLRAEWARDLASWQLLMQGAWNEAFKRFLTVVHAQDGEPIRTWRELADLWVGVANDTLVETHRTPEFLEAQRRLTRSSTECRLAEREIAEAYCEIHQIPTRTEVDELSRAVYELRRDLRALTKSMQRGKPAKAPRGES